jgi:hypothetical protein
LKEGNTFQLTLADIAKTTNANQKTGLASAAKSVHRDWVQ